MELQEYIEMLQNQPKDKMLKVGLGNPHSWRGSYSELSFEPVDNITIGEMLECAEGCIGKTFTGWKGGDYKMNEYTDIHIEREDGSYSDNTFIFNWFLELLLDS